MAGPFDFILELFGFADPNQTPITSCSGAETNVCAALVQCQGSDPCQAAWQATYQYYADRQWDMAQWQSLIGMGIAYLQYASADRTADLQYDLADRQLKIAEEEYARYKCVYVECEDALNAVICAEELPDVQYDVYADRAVRDVRKQFGILRAKLDRQRQRYCLSDHVRTMCDIEKSEALTVIAAKESAYRYAETRRDFLEARRWERRSRMLTHGRDIFSGQSSSYNAGLNTAVTALESEQRAKNNLFGNLYSIGSNLLGTYYDSRYFTPYPFGVPGGSGPASGPSGINSSGPMFSGPVM